MKITSVIVIAVVCLLLGSLLGYGAHSLFHHNIKPPLQTEANAGNDDTASDSNADRSGDSSITTVTPPPSVHETFNQSNAMAHIYYLSTTIGPRPEGSAQERRAADYIHSELSALGYSEVMEQSFPLVNGLTSYNVYAEDKGSNPAYTIIVGAHYDTAGGKSSPGGNDNGSGVGAVLELARVFKANNQVPNLRFAAFGAEEITEGYGIPNHHYGAKCMAAQLAGEQTNVIGMLSIDMIGVGTSLYVNATLLAPKTFLDLFYAYAAKQNIQLNFRQDPGWSDHDAFEAHGISSFWIEYKDDPNYHSPSDTYDHVRADLVSQVGVLVQEFLESLDADTCSYLDSISNYK